MSAVSITRESLAQHMRSLPPMPHTLMKVWQLVDQPNTNAQTLGEAIARDPSLMASLLRLANSAFYGRERHVSTLSQAITVLGFDAIKKMCMGTILQVTVQRKSDAPTRFDKVQFWRHSLSTGLAAEGLAAELNLPMREQAFSHGLLHDIGLLALDRVCPKELSDMFECRDREQRPLHEVELERLGMDHAEVGFMLAECWNFATSMQEGIRYHREPRRDRQHEVEVLVHLACAITDPQEFCHCGKDPGRQESVEYFGLTEVQLEHVHQYVMDRLVMLAQAFRV